MYLTCTKEKLWKAASLAEKVSLKNANLPALQSILLLADKNSLSLRATNLEIGIEMDIPAQIKEKGTTSVPASVLSRTISGLGNEKNITLTLQNQNLFLTTSHTTATIKSHPTDDFPTLPTVSDGETLTIPIRKLINGISTVLFSASSSDVKPELSGVYLYPEGNSIVFVATDSFRLAEKKEQHKKTNDFPGIIIPGKNAAMIARIFEDAQGDVVMRANKNQLSIQHEGIFITSRLANGVFPDYQQIIPKGATSSAILLKQDFISALKMSNVFSDSFNRISLMIDPKEKTFSISSRNADIGEGVTKIEASLSGENISATFNHRYLLDATQAIPEDSIVLEFSGSQKQLVMKGLGNHSFLYLAMPINT